MSLSWAGKKSLGKELKRKNPKTGNASEIMIALLGTNDKKTAKRDLLEKTISLLKNPGWLLEASRKMEEILSNSNVPYIEDPEIIADIVGKDKKPEMVKHGYYTRLLSKTPKRILKRMYGKVK